MIRLIEEWQAILRGMEPKAAAKRILGDVYYYSPRMSSRHTEPPMCVEDRQQLANALEAWHRLRTDNPTLEGANVAAE